MDSIMCPLEHFFTSTAPPPLARTPLPAARPSSAQESLSSPSPSDDAGSSSISATSSSYTASDNDASSSTSPSAPSTNPSSATSSITSSPACSPNLAIDGLIPLRNSDSYYLDSSADSRKQQNIGRRRAAAGVQCYAASVVRREAKALLDLANRLEAGHAEAEAGELDGGNDVDGADGATFTQAVHAISSMHKYGKLVFTGVGKSGLLARKAVATFNSLGIQSVFLHPVEALHGDLGVISPYGLDIVLMVSYSGRTKELLSLTHLLRHKQCQAIISVTKPFSPLSLASDITLDASVEGDEEVDAAVPAPTSSVVTALAILDALGLSVLRHATGWDADGAARRQVFAANHPGGNLGQQLVHSL